MTSILDRIAQHKRAEVALERKKKPIESLQFPETIRDFTAALHPGKQPAIIAELKKASPSQGLLRADFDAAEIARTYAEHGARCLSVLTDTAFFQGHARYLQLAKSQCVLPVLRKDFIIDAYQIHQSRALGADCVLLIVALLDDQQLLDYCQLAQELGMAVLVESHSREELDRALLLPTPLIGINNRNLHSFKTDIQLSIDLRQYLPEDRILISESGITSRKDIELLQANRIHAFLIGEYLMRSKQVGKALADLLT